jgi:hypothetical protein
MPNGIFRETKMLWFFLASAALLVLTGCSFSPDPALTAIATSPDGTGQIEAEAIPGPTAVVLNSSQATTTPAATPNWPATITPVATTAATATPLATATPELGFYAPPGRALASLEAFWNGEAEWVLEVADTGLPLGESDTVYQGGNELWSYLHASQQSAGVVDQCGDPVPFPGCVTRWVSVDAGQTFSLTQPVCLFSCDACPCDNRRDHIGQQQYPRTFFAEDEAYLAYEFGAYVFVRTSADGINWSDKVHVDGTWIWTYPYGPCAEYEVIGFHPNIYSDQEWDCLAGGPPGIYVEGEDLYVFVGLGKAPGHMGCYKGDRRQGGAAMQECENNPLFTAEAGYGSPNLLGPDANPYFEFRTISSADVVKVGDHYYMTYEGIRGPSDPSVVDDQFALGLARSVEPVIDGAWEKYPGNPIILDLPGNVGVGHADIVLIGQATYLYATTEAQTRGRYVLLQRSP